MTQAKESLEVQLFESPHPCESTAVMDLVTEMVKTLDSLQPRTEVMRSSREIMSLKCRMQRSMMAKSLGEGVELIEELSAE